MKILFLSHTPMGGDFVVGSHHLARELAALGHQVVHISPPVTPAHVFLLKNKFERIRIKRWLTGGEIINGVIDAVPASILPWGAAKRISPKPHQIFGTLSKLSIESILGKYFNSQPDLVLIDEPRLATISELFPNSQMVYRVTDLYAKIRNDEKILLAEEYLIKKANKIIATSKPVSKHLQEIGAKSVDIIENGVDLNIFTPDQKKTNTKRPQAIYVGAFDHRFGHEEIEISAQQNAEVDFILIGPHGQDIKKKLGKYKNIKLLGGIEINKLPKYLGAATLALLPLSKDKSNAGRSPMKLYEYGAMGLPVVATWTPELERRNLSFVVLCKDAHSFAMTIKEIASGTLSLPSGEIESKRHGWPQITQQILQIAMANK